MTQKCLDPMNIAIFGDLHGRVLMPFYLASRWQEERGEKIHHLLSVGDLGIFRGFHHMDKASRRWAQKHPEELGFSKFFLSFDLASGRIQRHPEATRVLEATKLDMLFVPGNHEEHQYFGSIWDLYASSMDEPVPVDLDWAGISADRYGDQEFCGYGRIHLLPQGATVRLSGPLDETTWEPQYELRFRAINGIDAYTPSRAWSVRSGERVDLLLTHETAFGRLKGFDDSGRRDDWGSERLLELIRRLAPTYHFFGHHHWYYPEVKIPTNRGRPTRSVGLNQVIFRDHVSTLSRWCFGILRVKGPDDMIFEIVDDDWIQGLMPRDCERIL